MTTSEPPGPAPDDSNGSDAPQELTTQVEQPTAEVEHLATASDTSATEPLMEPQAAAELAQELTLVTRALFAQLLPSTSARAIAGVDWVAGAAQGSAPESLTEPPAHHPAAAVPTTQPTPAPAAPDLPASPGGTAPMPVPVAVPAPAAVAVPPTTASSTAPAAPAGVPVPSVPVPGIPEASTTDPGADEAARETAVPSASVPVPSIPVPAVPAPESETAPGPANRGPRTLAMLDEIGFLDD